MQEFEDIYNEVVGILRDKLPTHLTYHDIDHTIHVLEKAEMIGTHEGVGERHLYLIRIAALFHDIGFIRSREQHEAFGCQIAKRMLKKRHLLASEIRKIQGMIMATKLPQRPMTPYEAILADADLEYIGTDDYAKVSGKLYEELKHYNPQMTENEWINIQIRFLEEHRFHTPWCIQNRSAKKMEHLDNLKSKLK